jgi:excisionase family DNA binding protein
MPRTNPARYSDPLRGTRTIREAARLVGCSDTKVLELIHAGELQAITVGNRRLPTVTSLERLLGRSIAELEAAIRKAPAAA